MRPVSVFLSLLNIWLHRNILGWTIVSQQGRTDQKCHCPYIRTLPRFCFYPGLIFISIDMQFSALILLLVSSLSVTAALPIPGTSDDYENDRSVITPSGWRFFSKTSVWTASVCPISRSGAHWKVSILNSSGSRTRFRTSSNHQYPTSNRQPMPP